MGGDTTPPEHEVQCLPPDDTVRGKDVLRIVLDGRPVGIKLRISHLTRQLVADLPVRALDLLEIAALVYGIDAAVSRGGTTDLQMGVKWHRRFLIRMPVRDLEFWTRGDVRTTLEEMLMFLSGDRVVFEFAAHTGAGVEATGFFQFDRDSGWQASRVLMFSGGLDSFAGALEEIVERQEQVALVSHFSSTKIAPVQRNLVKAVQQAHGDACCHHIPVQVQMTNRGLKEGTHRSRSFLFASLGAITAQAFSLQRVSFHENGVVSLNLPPVGNVLGTRATRTTHPQTLTRFTDLMNKVFEGGMRIDNPFFWRTKTEVVETVARLGMQDQIRHTRSCADVHNQTKQHPHCGRCSQCIDRRFAVIAAGLERHDPDEAYRVSLMDHPREDVRDREIALSYLRNAQFFAHVTPEDLERTFPAVLHAVQHLDQPPTTALDLITRLLGRHGRVITAAMRQATDQIASADFPKGSLPALYGELQLQVNLPAVPTVQSVPDAVETVMLEFDPKKRLVRIDKHVKFQQNAIADLLIVLAEQWLVGAGQGLERLDFPFVQANTLAAHFEVDGDEAVRKRIMRARKALTNRLQSAGWDGGQGSDLIENQPWLGYRLAPDRVSVRRLSQG